MLRVRDSTLSESGTPSSRLGGGRGGLPLDIALHPQHPGYSKIVTHNLPVLRVSRAIGLHQIQPRSSILEILITIGATY